MRALSFLIALVAADELLTWFSEKGGKMGQVEVRDTAAEGRGVFATKALSKGTVAVAVPSALFLRAKVCLDDTKSRLITIPSKVQWQLRDSPALTALCLLELQIAEPAAWEPYLSSLKPPAALPLLEALAGKDLNQTLQGSQLLREVQQKLGAVAKLYQELNSYTSPPLDSWTSEAAFVAAYALIESRAHTESGAVVVVPVADLLNHASSPNAELVATASGLEVRVTRHVAEGEELYVSYLALHGQRRSAFFRQFAVDDATLPNELKLGFHLRTTDPLYAEKKLRFPQHMVEAKKLYAELAYLLPYDKKQEQAQALSFPHYLELKCDKDLKPQPHEVMEFLRFVVAPRLPTAEECPGTPPRCPAGVFDEKTEVLAHRRYQHDLLKIRGEYQDFAAPLAGGAGPLLDDERRCLDAFLTEAGAPPPPVVGLYSGFGFIFVLSAMALFRAQRAIWLSA